MFHSSSYSKPILCFTCSLGLGGLWLHNKANCRDCDQALISNALCALIPPSKEECFCCDFARLDAGNWAAGRCWLVVGVQIWKQWNGAAFSSTRNGCTQTISLGGGFSFAADKRPVNALFLPAYLCKQQGNHWGIHWPSPRISFLVNWALTNLTPSEALTCMWVASVWIISPKRNVPQRTLKSVQKGPNKVFLLMAKHLKVGI